MYICTGHALIMSYRAFSYWLVINPLFQQNFAAIKVGSKQMRFMKPHNPQHPPLPTHPPPT